MPPPHTHRSETATEGPEGEIAVQCVETEEETPKPLPRTTCGKKLLSHAGNLPASRYPQCPQL